MRPICGNRVLCIGATGLSPRRGREASHQDEREQYDYRAVRRSQFCEVSQFDLLPEFTMAQACWRLSLVLARQV
jgi:hypothetical protein